MKAWPTEPVIKRVEQFLAARPFLPFYIEPIKGRRLRVASERHAAVSPKSHRVVVWLDDDGQVTLAVSDIESVDKESKWDRKEAQRQIAIKGMELLQSGMPIELAAKQMKVPLRDLTNWVGKLRLDGD